MGQEFLHFANKFKELAEYFEIEALPK